jgi:hypothetical protein
MAWPETIDDMFNGAYTGGVKPWSPVEHPTWEVTYWAMQGPIAMFRNAAEFSYYGYPLGFNPLTPYEQAQAMTPPDEERPLAGVLLPSLASHRAIVKSTLANGWRSEYGRVPPEQMLDAIKTCLRAADHMEQGYTLIHQLVGVAEKNLTHSNALEALKHNVFSTPDQIESALNTLMENDRPIDRSAAFMAGEHACAMDAIQYLYPPGADGQPRLDARRADYFVRSVMGNDKPEDVSVELQKLAQVTPDQVRQAADKMDGWFRAIEKDWQTGYPSVRASGLGGSYERDCEAAARTNPLIGTLMPSLSRAYHITGRVEASRRATQLTYAVHLFKAQTGRWPASLDELPTEHGETMRTDPFTGRQFGYRLTETPPTIYSASENGRDDGGVHSPHWADDRKDSDSDDYVFWPPQ